MESAPDTEPLDLFLAQIKNDYPTASASMREVIDSLRDLAARGATITLPAIGVLGLAEVAFQIGLMRETRKRETYAPSDMP